MEAKPTGGRGGWGLHIFSWVKSTVKERHGLTGSDQVESVRLIVSNDLAGPKMPIKMYFNFFQFF